MSSSGSTTFRASILDRLSEGEGQGAHGSAQDYRRGVLRDIEWLLNHRRTIEPAPESCPETRRSVYHYGLPDLTSVSAESSQSLARVRSMIEEALRLFEPRLESVKVRLADDDAPEGRSRIRFVIEGLLRMDPHPELLRFDTVMQPGGGGFKVTSHA